MRKCSSVLAIDLFQEIQTPDALSERSQTANSKAPFPPEAEYRNQNRDRDREPNAETETENETGTEIKCRNRTPKTRDERRTPKTGDR